jgi:hypothetical protein
MRARLLLLLDAAAFAILREVVKYVTPGSPINF